MLVLLSPLKVALAPKNVWLIDIRESCDQCSSMAGVGAAHQIYEVFGARVRAERDALNLTQLELSSRIGLTRGSVANIEAGRQSVLLHQLLAIASALKVTPEQLLPVMAEPQATRKDPEMPETVLAALKEIRKTTGPKSSSRP